MVEKSRCAWVSDDPLSIDYHDHEWGQPLYDSKKLFELLVLEGMQAGLSWITILRKRENYRQCFDHFNIEKIARYNKPKVDQLVKNPGIIRHRLKIEAIIKNAQAYLALKNKGENFSDFIWQFVEGKPIINHWATLTEVPVKTTISEDLSKQLKRQGFSFVGPTICYAFMQAAGLVNDHTTNCFLSSSR